jgi:hypothetical protein
MIEVNTIKTNIPIPRSAIPSDCDISNLAASLSRTEAVDKIDMSKLLKVTLPSGRLSTNYILVNTGDTFNNISNNEPVLYYLTVFDKTSMNKILYTVPVRWCGRVNGTVVNAESNLGVYQNFTNPKPIKYFEV